MKPWIRTGCALFVAFASVPLVAQQSTNGAEPATQQAPRAGGGVKEGVSLHGNWALDIRDPDGTLVRHSEFKNALTGTGQGALAELLTGTRPVNDWMVEFDGAFRVFKSGGPFATSVSPSLNSFPTLSITSAGPNLVLTGTYTVSSIGFTQVERVITYLMMGPNDFRTFTSATAPTPVPVSPGQIVQFTYTLSFS